jgi:hypothetical protein
MRATTTTAAREFKAERLDKLSSSFAHPPSDMALSPDEIHIWLADLDQSESQLHTLTQTLSLEERLRAENYYFERDRKRYLLRHGILRAILGLYLHVEPGRYSFNMAGMENLRLLTQSVRKSFISTFLIQMKLHFLLSPDSVK